MNTEHTKNKQSLSTQMSGENRYLPKTHRYHLASNDSVPVSRNKKRAEGVAGYHRADALPRGPVNESSSSDK